MSVHPLAGKQINPRDALNVPKLMTDYYTLKPDVSKAEQKVSFGTSGHRGSAQHKSFNEGHIQAICQAICEYRTANQISGPLYLGKDTHALSEPAFYTALSVLLANGVQVIVQADWGYTPTPVISRQIICFNRSQKDLIADGIVITPSHNPPQDGGIKYNPPHGGPAEAEITQQIELRANEIIAAQYQAVKSICQEDIVQHPALKCQDFIQDYVEQLSKVIDCDAIAKSNINIAVDPMGGAGIDYWPVIAKRYQINLTLVNDEVDPTFKFMPADKDGKIRMDCSSPYAMSGLIKLKENFDLAVGNDADFDRHGIVTPDGGLMNPNHFLAVAIHYLFTHRNWHKNVKVGKTLVSSSLIDRVAAMLGRELCEVPVGFKWFVDGLANADFGFAGEESAGATFIEKNGSTWTTDKDGFVMTLLAAEIHAVTGKTAHQYLQDLLQKLGKPYYGRVEAPATVLHKQALNSLEQSKITTTQLAGEPIVSVLTKAQGNQADIGGVKVVTANGWFAARPSGTEDIYKIYAESFVSENHLQQIITQAQTMLSEYFQNFAE